MYWTNIGYMSMTLLMLWKFDLIGGFQHCQSEDPCVSAEELFEPHERFLNCKYNASANLCDRHLVPKWYKSYVNMPRTCPNLLDCGALYPIWLNGELPTTIGMLVARKACKVGFSDCCVKEYDVQIKHCGAFMVYCLSSADGCPERYCFGETGMCNETFVPDSTTVAPQNLSTMSSLTPENTTSVDKENNTVHCDKNSVTYNVAFRKNVTLSSLFFFNTDTSYAVDGVVSDKPGYDQLAHTGFEARPWLRIDLGSIFKIDEVAIFNRKDKYGERLHDVIIRVGKTPEWENMTVCGNVNGGISTEVNHTIVCLGCLQGRFVMMKTIKDNDKSIQKDGYSALVVAEVYVMGTPSNESNEITYVEENEPNPPNVTELCTKTQDFVEHNVAINKTVTLSSIFYNGTLTDASFAVDGRVLNGSELPNKAFDIQRYELASTAYEERPWLRINLGVIFKINRVTVFNRKDNNGEWFHDVDVRVGKTTEWNEMAECGRFLGTSSTGFIHTIQCIDCLYGRYVTLRIVKDNDRKIQKDGYNKLTVAEVNVIAELAAKLQVSKTSLNILEGKEFSVTCVLTNSENMGSVNVFPNLEWTKNGQIVSTNEYNISSEKTFNTSSTTIGKSKSTLLDTARFCCHSYTFKKQSCTVLSINRLSQPAKDAKLCLKNIDVYGILWPTSPSNSVLYNPCSSGQEGRASRRCSAEGQWLSSDTSQCYSPIYQNILNQLDELNNETSKEVIESALNDSIKNVLSTTENSTTIAAGDIKQIVSILDTVVNTAKVYNASVVDQSAFEIIDDLTARENHDSWKVLGAKGTNDSTDISTIFTLVDNITTLLRTNDKTINFTGQNIVMSLTKTTSGSDIVFPKGNESASYLILQVQNQTNQSESIYAGVLYKTMSSLMTILTLDSNNKLYGDTSEDNIAVNSEILSLSVNDAPEILSPPIHLTFSHSNKSVFDPQEAKCVFWNFNLGNASGEWSTEGCSVIENGIGFTSCQCNHLTNFAVLMRPYKVKSKEEHKALHFISIVGCSVSIFFSVLTIVLYFLVWRYIKSQTHELIICLCLSILISFILFIIGGETTTNEVACKLLTAAIHYSMLVIFFVMLSIGLFYFTKVTIIYYSLNVGSRLSAKLTTKTIVILSWGFPVIIAGVTLGSFWSSEYHLPNFCWLSISNGALYTFIIPVLIIITINIIVIISLLRVMMSTSNMKNSDIRTKAVAGLRSLGIQLPVLGVTWLFGIFAVSNDAIVFQYIFVITNSLQGLFIFLFHVVLNTKVKEGFRRKYNIRSMYSTDMTAMKTDTTSVLQPQDEQKEQMI